MPRAQQLAFDVRAKVSTLRGLNLLVRPPGHCYSPIAVGADRAAAAGPEAAGDRAGRLRRGG